MDADRERRRVYMREYRARNRNTITNYNRTRYQQNRNRILQESRLNYANNSIIHQERSQIQRNSSIERRRRSYFKSGILGTANNFIPGLHDFGELILACNFCSAVHFTNEAMSSCCHKGKIFHNVNQQPFPIDLKQLFTGTDINSKNFREFIRQYNNANAFASMGANIIDIPGRGPYCLKISGEVYHRTSKDIQMCPNLNPLAIQNQNLNPTFAQLYIYDSDVSTEYRMNDLRNSSCRRDIMRSISNVLTNVSPYAGHYRNLKQKFDEEYLRVQNRGGIMKKVSLLFTRNASDDQRVFNAPTTTNDIGVVFVTDRDGNIPAEIDFAVHSNDNNSVQRISMLSKHLDPMMFPLLFPNGEFGWTTNLLHNPDNATRVRNHVTILEFYSYKIAIRRFNFNPLHYAGKLYQHYLVYAYTRHEANRMQFLRKNQKQLRIESYQGLLDHVNNVGLQHNVRIGNIYILPSTYVGGPRFMAKLYQDNMAIVRIHGRPDLFVTFTCNPKWIEIVRELQSWQTAADRPDLVTRVFQLKLKEFLGDILKKQIFGEVIAYVYIIEHQKRGLPHAHCLFTLSDRDKIKTSDEVDKVISAELPNKENNSDLYNIILKHNVHGPCGDINSNSVCMIEGQCTKKFPKQFRDSTDATKDGYPQYKRKNNSHENHKNYAGLDVNNSFVVPYNSFLSQKFNAHINVELCSTVKAIKYIHKYITKGHDCARIGLQVDSENVESMVVNYDEITQYLNCRYVSGLEACWRLQELPVHGQSHVVFLLSLHLKNGQQIFFREEEAENVIRRESVQLTTLTSFFELNRTDPRAHNYFYQDIPKFYIFQNKMWERRSERSRFGNMVIGRIASVSPKNSELYHLRLLLISVKGLAATSFEKLKEYNGQIYESYKDVARARGLINDSEEWRNCMSEASSYMMPKSLRSLFVTILVHCFPSNIMEIWEHFKIEMAQDFIQHFTEEEAIALCLAQIYEQLESENYDISSSGLPQLQREIICQIRTNNNLVPDESQTQESLWEKLNVEQLMITNEILNSVINSRSNKCFYIDGPGGSGKTFMYKAIIQKLGFMNKKYAVVAWTGIAATLLPNGNTCHSTFNFSLDLSTVNSPRLTRTKREFLKSLDVLIWDEAPMAPGTALETVNLIFQDIMQNELNFGGKTMILGGDFRQVLPVIPKGSRGIIVASSIKSSFLWPTFKIKKLSKNMRCSIDPEFSEWIMKMGDGTLIQPIFAKTNYSIEIPEKYMSVDIVEDIYGNHFTTSDSVNMAKRAILSPKNEDVRVINDRVLNILDGPAHTYYAIDCVKNDSGDYDSDLQVNFPVEFLNSLNPAGLAPFKLKLKKGSIVMLLRNLSVKKGLCNGTRLIVKEFRLNVIQAEIIYGSFAGSIHFIPRVTLDTSNDSAIPFNLCRHQFPVRLAYAMTINKSQGQTFEKVGIYLPEPVFGHGQLYTACSRSVSGNSFKIQIIEGRSQGTDNMTKSGVTDNIVFNEIF